MELNFYTKWGGLCVCGKGSDERGEMPTQDIPAQSPELFSDFWWLEVSTELLRLREFEGDRVRYIVRDEGGVRRELSDVAPPFVAELLDFSKGRMIKCFYY